MDLGIENRTALVLGASRGLGRAIAETLGREGVRVALASRSADGLEEVAAGIDAETAVLPVDTGDEDAVAALPARVAAGSGRSRSLSSTPAARRRVGRSTPIPVPGGPPTSRSCWRR